MSRRRQQYRCQPCRTLSIQQLEARHLLAADLAITEVQLVDSQRQPISRLSFGEMAIVQAKWTTTDLTASDQYRVKFEMNGIDVYSQSISGSSGVNLPYSWWRGVGYASQGVQTITVTVDGDASIAEIDESNNSLSIQFSPQSPDLLEPFQWPIGGKAFKDWTVVNYSDIDLRPGERADFRGGEFQYDGHDALDLTLPNFARMESGVPVFAAASGTVVEVLDGNYDRNTGASPTPANLVKIDHGNGWVANYYHFQRDTIAVRLGDVVSPGQVLGLVGSSGNSSDAHLHFALYHDGARVEPMFAADEYFADGFPYQADLETTVLASGITNAAPWDDLKELPTDIRTFRSDATDDTWLWYRLSHLNVGDRVQVKWYRPDGTLDATYGFTADMIQRFSGQGWVRNTRNFPGLWQVDVLVNDKQLASESFAVVDSGGTAAIDVRYASDQIINRRSTPIEFVSVPHQGTPTQRTFSLSNRGTAPLTISEITLPDGFSFVGSVPGSIAVEESASIVIELDTELVGLKYGDVIIHSNADNHPSLTFAVRGEITGSLPQGSPVLASSLPALVLVSGRSHAPLFPDAIISDPNTTDFGESILTAEIVAGLRTGDRLILSSSTGAASNFSVQGDTILYSATPIGTLLADGAAGRLVVEFDANVEREVVEALVRDIRFWATDSNTEAGRRDASLAIRDPTGLSADPIRRSIITDGSFLDSNVAPTDINLDAHLVDENQASSVLVGKLTASDLNSNDSFQFRLVSGSGSEGNQYFAITGDELRTAATFDFEDQSSYTVRIEVEDSGGLTLAKSLAIAIADVNEAPTALGLLPSSVDENQATGSLVGLLTAQDPDAGDNFVFQLVAGSGDEDNGLFEVIDNSIMTRLPFDHEASPTRSIRVEAIDSGGLKFANSLPISIGDLNEAPTDIDLAPSIVDENSPSGTIVGSLSSQDQDAAESFAYSLVSGVGDTDNASFTIENNVLKTAASLDHEQGATRSVRIQTTDRGGLTHEKAFSIEVVDVNESPTQIDISNSTLAESAPIGSKVGALSSRDPDTVDSAGTFVYTLVPGVGSNDNALFAISEVNQLVSAVEFNYEMQDEYSVRVRSTDKQGLFLERSFLIKITDSDEPPSDITLDADFISENLPEDSLIASLTASDPDILDSASFSLVAGAGDTDNASFSIAGSELRSATVFDFESKSSYTVRIRATDTTDLSFEKAFNISVRNENEVPSDIVLDSNLVDENEDIGTFVGNLSGIDPDQDEDFTFALVSGDGDEDNASFSITGDELKTERSFDFEQQASHRIRVEATDSGGLAFSKPIVISVVDANERPSEINLSNGVIAENLPAGATIGDLTTIDPDAADEFFYTLIDERTLFEISESRLRTLEPLDFELQNEYRLTIRVTDRGGLTLERDFAIRINDENDAPTDLGLDNYSIAENQPVGSLVGTLGTLDQDSEDSHTFSFVNGDGDSDNGLFRIESDRLVTNEIFDYETANEYQIRLLVQDAAGATFEKAHVISVIDVDEFEPEDVNADFFVSPIDALLVVNRLNSNSSNRLGPEENSRLDVNRDTFISPIDALLVINYLNRQVGGVGESNQSPPQWTDASEPNMLAWDAFDFLFGALGNKEDRRRFPGFAPLVSA